VGEEGKNRLLLLEGALKIMPPAWELRKIVFQAGFCY
jgi:hypothetical protein